MSIILYTRLLSSRLKKSSLILSSSISSSSTLSLQYRDVFISDSSYKYHDYVTNMNNLKHPSSSHAIASYSNFIHHHSTYHFNSLGEYSLNVNPGHIISTNSRSTSSNSNSTSSSSSSSSTHDMIVWPDRLYIKGLTNNEIPTIMKLIFKDNLISASSLSSILPSSCNIVSIPNTVIVSSTSSIVNSDNANLILKYFKNIIINEENGNDDDFMFLLVPEMRGHRLGANVLILNINDKIETAIDSTKILMGGEKSARDFWRKFCLSAGR